MCRSGPWHYPEDQITDAPLAAAGRRNPPAKSSICDSTRNCLINRRSNTNSWKELKDGSVRIEQTIYVERMSQRKIVLGKAGRPSRRSAPKRGARSRTWPSTRCNLFLFVKVREAWGDDPERYPRDRARVSRRNSAAHGRQEDGLMQWVDEAFVLGVKRHGEASAILELMTREHGRHLGLVRGASGARLRPVLQPGNRVSVTWAGAARRASGQLCGGGARSRGGTLPSTPSHALYGLMHIAGLCRLPAGTRSPPRYPRIARPLCSAYSWMCGWRGPAWRVSSFNCSPSSVSGLDLDSCAATGSTTDLV